MNNPYPELKEFYYINPESTPKNPLTPYPPKGGLPNSIIFRCSPLGLGVKQMKIIEFFTFRSGLNPQYFLFHII